MGRRTAVLISGSGSNLQALLDATAAPGASAEIVLVVSNRAEAFGLQRARRAGVPALVVPHRDFPDRPSFDAALDAALREAGVELVCLAGFMRLLTGPFVEAWRDRMLNIHPSLLPSFRGADAHVQALAAGVRITGCTVHLVRPEMDTGPILLQGLVPVLPGDTVETLSRRTLEVEHVCYPRALDLVASGRVSVEAGRARIAGIEPGRLLVRHPMLGAG
ncbi:MAG TPA: phosphoribosylglycinamide formyltransferase [Geminicoccaceae bacterium]|nr:phosphoribosylglycinamide formyltransferase [Geminicoccus sp.]HMU49344.1 phosphoribosylglycinamide formyltransferase [Geminicoccaceae bacterium]